MNNKGNILVETLLTVLLFFTFISLIGSAYYLFYCQTWVQHLAYRSGVCQLAHDRTSKECQKKNKEFRKLFFLTNTTIQSSQYISKNMRGAKLVYNEFVWHVSFFKPISSQLIVSDQMIKK